MDELVQAVRITRVVVVADEPIPRSSRRPERWLHARFGGGRRRGGDTRCHRGRRGASEDKLTPPQFAHHDPSWTRSGHRVCWPEGHTSRPFLLHTRRVQTPPAFPRRSRVARRFMRLLRPVAERPGRCEAPGRDVAETVAADLEGATVRCQLLVRLAV